MSVMKSKAGRLLVVESGDALREHIVAVLSDAGYEVSTDYGEGMKAILAFDPAAVVLGANPPQLDCCDLLSQIKGSEHTQYIRVLMLSLGGSGERSEEHTSELQSPCNLVCRLLLEKKIQLQVCTSQYASLRPQYHVKVGCGLLILNGCHIKLPVISLLDSRSLNTVTNSHTENVPLQ